jgi:hypothetical protein
MAYDTTIVLQSPTRLSRERVKLAVLAIPGVRAAEGGQFLYEEPGSLPPVRVQITADEAETTGRITLAFDQSAGEYTLLAASNLALQLSQALPVELSEPDEWLSEDGYRSLMGQPANEPREQPAVRAQVRQGVLSSRTELVPSRMGEANTNRGVSVAVQLLFISVFIFMIYLGPHPLREIVIALGVVLEVAVAIWSATRRRRRYPEGS